MRWIFAFTLVLYCLFFSIGNMQAQSTASNDYVKQRMALFNNLKKSGYLNEIEYRQLKDELLHEQYGLTDLNLLGENTNKTKATKTGNAHIIAGASLFPAGMGMFAFGLLKFNEKIEATETDIYEYREQMNKRYGISMMTSGWVVGIAGVYLAAKGIHIKKTLRTRSQADMNLSLNIGSKGLLNLSLNF